MEPRSGGLWRPDSSGTPLEGNADDQGVVPAPVSAYDGYDLTDPAFDRPQQPQETEMVYHEVTWEASEYIQHDKDFGWFVILFFCAAVLLGIALFFRQWTFAALVVAMTTAIFVYARRPPRILHYTLAPDHFLIENKEFNYQDFKAFGLGEDGPLNIVTLLPRKRFAPSISMYFETKDGEHIVDALSEHMPLQPFHRDRFDELVRKLRF